MERYSLSSYRTSTFLSFTLAAPVVLESIYLICFTVLLIYILMDPPLQILSLCLDSRYVAPIPSTSVDQTPRGWWRGSLGEERGEHSRSQTQSTLVQFKCKLHRARDTPTSSLDALSRWHQEETQAQHWYSTGY